MDRAKQHIAELICFRDVRFESGGALSLETKRTIPGLLARKLSQADDPLRSTDLAQRCATACSSSSEGSSRRCLQFTKVLGQTIVMHARKEVGAALGVVPAIVSSSSSAKLYRAEDPGVHKKSLKWAFSLAPNLDLPQSRCTVFCF